ncbi:MAG: Nif3-like dinuclear metal center hexameric protein [Bacteroidales bacterium]
MQIKEIIEVLEDFAPLSLQESYDNAGLVLGSREKEVNSVLLCLDVTGDVLKEAKRKGAGLIISHHPVIFGNLKKLTGASYTEQIILEAVQNDIALYSAHTNIDSVYGGVNSGISEKIGLKNTQILSPATGMLRKLVVFVPIAQAQSVREAIFSAGAGHIGEYDQCSFNTEGTGSFRGSENSDPYTGRAGSLHFETEIRIETIYPGFLEKRIIKNMIVAHPYEEVAYDIYPLENKYMKVGMGMSGLLEEPMDVKQFLELLKDLFGVPVIKHSRVTRKKIHKVALCGGSGSFLIDAAINSGACIYLSADFKYHDFFRANDQMMIADIGHFESEQFTLEIFNELLTKKFPNFAIHFSDVNTNPIYYF